jgi:hypothetical protein
VAQLCACLDRELGPKALQGSTQHSTSDAEHPGLPPSQAEVEHFYISSGYLIPNFHRVYWIGLATNTTNWPRFRWLDRSQPGQCQTRAALLKAYKATELGFCCTTWCRCAVS